MKIFQKFLRLFKKPKTVTEALDYMLKYNIAKYRFNTGNISAWKIRNALEEKFGGTTRNNYSYIKYKNTRFIVDSSTSLFTDYLDIVNRTIKDELDHIQEVEERQQILEIL